MYILFTYITERVKESKTSKICLVNRLMITTEHLVVKENKKPCY